MKMSEALEDEVVSEKTQEREKASAPRFLGERAPAATAPAAGAGLAGSEVPKAVKPETRGAQRPRQRRKAVYLIGIIVLSFAGLIAATAYVLSRRARVTAKVETAIPTDTLSVVTLSPDQRAAIAIEVAQLRTLRADVTVPGKIAFDGNRMTPVFSQFSGRIVKLEAEVGSTVRAGQVIGTIDTPDIVGMQSDYLQAITAERSASTTLELAKRTRERTERLAEAEAVPRRDLQQAQADESRAADDLQRARSAVAGARGRLQSAGMSETEIIRLASGSRAVNRLVPLAAPIAGTVTERKAGVGQVVQPGAGDPLLMIADLSSVWVNADVYEDQLAHIQLGTSVRISTPAYPNETFAARVGQIGSTLDPDKHTVAVRCVVSNPGRRLKPGMFASVILNAAVTQQVITIPSSAVVAEGDHRSVFIEESPGKYLKRDIETGNEIDGAVIIRSGLKEGERVVVRGSLLISAGQTE
jgi:cobalt-zinc-cadmium efflux system membrane fusion protein